MADKGFIYFVQPGRTKTIKIGYATDVAKRIAALQTGQSLKLRALAVTPGTRWDERRWHDRFASDRVRGEWFKLSDRLQKAIDKLNGHDPSAVRRFLLKRAREMPEPTMDELRAMMEQVERYRPIELQRLSA